MKQKKHWKLIHKALIIYGVFLFIGCVDLDPERVKSPHYRDGSYHNLDESVVHKSFFQIARRRFVAKLSHFFSFTSPDIEDMDESPPPVTPLRQQQLLAPPGKVRLVWLGHATVWIASNKNGKRTHIITDPMFGKIVFFMKRFTPLPIEPQELPKIDAVIVSHAHQDHFDISSLRLIQKMNPEAQFLLPSGAQAIARKNKLNAHCKEWWQSVAIQNSKIRYVPAHHWSRLLFNDLRQIHWGSYVLELSGRRIFFAGDTAYSSHISKIAQRYPNGFSAALLPIAPYKPRSFMKSSHINPEEALQIAEELQAKLMFPIHWGAFNMGEDYLQEAFLLLKKLVRNEKDKHRPVQFWYPGQYLDI